MCLQLQLYLLQLLHCLIDSRAGPLQHRTEPANTTASVLLTAAVSSFSERALLGALDGCARVTVAAEMTASTGRVEARS